MIAKHLTRIGAGDLLRTFYLVGALVCLGGISAQAQCKDAWVTQAVNEVKGSPIVASDCTVTNYGGGHWTTYADLKAKVTAYFTSGVCVDAWVTQAVRAVKGSVNGGGTARDCNVSNYGNGQWSSYPDLQNKVTAYFHPPVAAPPPPPAPRAPAGPIVARILLPNNLCLGVEGGSRAQAARLIRWSCTNVPDQQFGFMPDGTIRTFSGQGLCVDDKGGVGNPGDSIDTWACNGTKGQQWRLQNYNLKSGLNGFCLSVRGGIFIGNADAILSQCSGTQNQTWMNYGQDVSRPGVQAVLSGGGQPAQYIALQPGGASGSGNIVAAGGGNIVAAGGGNIRCGWGQHRGSGRGQLSIQ